MITGGWALTLHHQGHTFEIRSEPLDPFAPRRPDERWHFVDHAGHHHQWEWPDGRRVYQPDQPASLPTCTAMQVVQYIEGEEHRTVRYECALCRAPVEPGRAPQIPRRTFLVDGEVVTEKVFLELLRHFEVPPSNV